MFSSQKSAKFIRVALSIAIMALTCGVMARPQSAAHAADYTLTTCNTSELITAWNNAIASTANDSIYLKSGCTYTFTEPAVSGSNRALADLPATSIAGVISLYGNGATVQGAGSGSNLGFLNLLTDSNLSVFDLTVTAFQISNEIGAGFRVNVNTILNITDSAMTANAATGSNGGAIWTGLSSRLSVNATLFYNNSADNGGAIRLGNINAVAEITNSSFINNVANIGGAISSTSGVSSSVTNSTFVGNSARANGGAFALISGTHEMRNLTLYGNEADWDMDGAGDGGGLYLSGTSSTPVKLHNSVIAKNRDRSPSGTLYPDTIGTVDVGGKNNFIGDGTGLVGIINSSNGNQVGTAGSPLDPRLSSSIQTRIGKYGLALSYVAPLPNSPLINNGNNSESSSLYDGRLYRRILYGTVDIGAIEFKRPDSPVVVNPANQGWLFRYTNSAGPVELSFLYGQGLSDYQPIVGDWNGDDIDTQGVYTRFTSSNIGVFALSNTFNSFDSSTLPSFAYTDASPNWQPTAGDWDGNGADSVGAYNVSTGVWVLTNNNSSTAPSYAAFSFGGGAGILPLSGDWNGDGRDSIGIYNFANSRFILSDGIVSSASVNYNFIYGASGYYPTVGDWNGDGIDTPALYNPSTGQWLLRNTNDTGTADIAFVYGQGSNLIGRVGQWRNVTPGNGTGPIRESAVTPIVPVVTPDAPQIAPTFAP